METESGNRKNKGEKLHYFLLIVFANYVILI